jgi:hypothetical protein
MAQLSDLQVKILARAIENMWRGADEVHVYGSEVAADHFGWPPPYRDSVDRKGRQRRSVYLPCRRPRGVTAQEANRVHASVCRAFRRLEARGLGERISGDPVRWSGFRLNGEGVKVAEQASRYLAMTSMNARQDREDDARKAAARAAPPPVNLWLDTPGAAKRLGIPVEKIPALIGKGLVRTWTIPRGGSDPLVLLASQDIERLCEFIKIVSSA